MENLMKEIRYVQHKYVNCKSSPYRFYDIPLYDMKYLKQFRGYHYYQYYNLEKYGKVSSVDYLNFLYSMMYNMLINQNQRKLKLFGVEARARRKH